MIAGKITGMVRMMVASSSMKNPMTMYIAITMATIASGGQPICVTRSASCFGICDNASAPFNMSAPRKTRKIMPEVTAVPRKLRPIPARLSSPRSRAATKVPAAPTAAPSVGVKNPA